MARRGHVIGPLLLVILGALGAPLRVAGQSCTEASVAARPDSWHENPANLALARGTAPAALHPGILKRIEPIAAMFREAYPTPRGTGAEGYKSIRRFGNELDGGPAQYGYVSLYKTWLCPKSTGQASRAGETGNWAYAYVNSLHFLLKELTEQPMHVDRRPTKVWLLARQIGSLRGEVLYEPWMGLSLGRALVFAKPGAFPWKPVSRAQYLDAIAAWGRSTRAAADSAADKLVHDLEQNLETMKATLKGETRDQVVAGLERELAVARETIQRNRERAAPAVAAELKAGEDYRASHSEAELAEPAILPPGTTLVFGGAFATEAEGGHRVVTLDPSFFRRDLPRDAAQLITLLWRWEDGPAAIAWRDTLERRFPIDELRALVGH